MKRTITFFSLIFLLSIGLWQCQTTTQPQAEKGSEAHIRTVTTAVDDAAIANGDKNQGDWLTYGRNYQEDRYSELDQITKENVKELGLAWAMELGTKRGIQSTPIVVDGILFATGPWSVVYAFDARKGTKIWEYDPQIPKGETATQLCCGVINRGVALYKGSVYSGTLDGRLIALDAATGKLNWEINTVEDTTRAYSITGAPRIANGKILIGNGGAEFDTRGYVTAYDAMTGKKVWRFYTVPGDPSQPFEHPDLEEAAKTWTGEWWKQGGGGTAWDAIVYDPDLNTVYIGVGNGTHWDRLHRSPEGGDNLYLSSIVALDADNGAYKWHYQTTPGDTWDYTATQHIILADLEIGGKQRKALMQAPKNGFFYVLDRVTGEFLSADNYVYMNWAIGIDSTGRPIEAEGARYEDGQVHWIAPSTTGGHNWQPMSFNRKTGMMYIPALSNTGPYYHNPAHGFDKHGGTASGWGGNVSLAGKLYIPQVLDTNEGAPLPNQDHGILMAYDPIKQEEVWSVKQPFRYNGGLLSTATGLLFQGDAEGIFSARDVDTGAVLWSSDLRSGILAPPITYLVDGEQYVTIVVGWGGSQGQSGKAVPVLHQGTIYTFKIGGDAEPPAKIEGDSMKAFATLKTDAEPLHIGRGFNLYMEYCVGCHMFTGQGGGNIPDLSHSSEGVFSKYKEIIIEGMLAEQGMPAHDMLTEEDVEHIKAYVLYTANALGSGVAELEYMTNIAKMQYLADQTPKSPENQDVEE